jgi:hypothetical protein
MYMEKFNPYTDITFTSILELLRLKGGDHPFVLSMVLYTLWETQHDFKIFHSRISSDYTQRVLDKFDEIEAREPDMKRTFDELRPLLIRLTIQADILTKADPNTPAALEVITRRLRKEITEVDLEIFQKAKCFNMLINILIDKMESDTVQAITQAVTQLVPIEERFSFLDEDLDTKKILRVMNKLRDNESVGSQRAQAILTLLVDSYRDNFSQN